MDFCKRVQIENQNAVQICFFRAATGKALTTVFAGCAFTFFSSPNIILTPAFVAGLTRVLMRQRPGMVKMPFFFTSAVAIATKLSSTSEQAFCFNSCSVAIAFVKAPFVIALLPEDFMEAARFIAFMVFMAFMGMV